MKDVFLKFCSLQSFQAGAYFTNMRHGNKVKITSDVAKAPKKLTYFDSLKEAEIEHSWVEAQYAKKENIFSNVDEKNRSRRHPRFQGHGLTNFQLKLSLKQPICTKIW